MKRRRFLGTSLFGSVVELVSHNLRANARSTSDMIEGRAPDSVAGQSKPQSVLQHRVYTHLLDPREHPDYARHYVRPPNWDTFDNRTQFATLRGFEVKGDAIINYAEAIQEYTVTYGLGDVLWPEYSILYAKNLGDLAEEIKRRRLYLFDVWNYCPGSGPGSLSAAQFQPPAGVFKLLESKLGDRWLGMDNGEQDGRYIGGYANEMYPCSAGRRGQYENFQRFFERLTDELGNKMSALVSLNFGHYFLKEGVYTLIGAETGQALPNGQIFYSFIRGAGKQYGVPWFGNASGFNRWGWKMYGPEVGAGGVTGGPTKGASLSLMKRLMYSQILYNSMLVGFDQGWFYEQKESGRTGTSQGRTGGKELSPIGQIQQAAGKWVREVGQPGAMITPIAVMLDFHAGWTFPRHLYTEDVYRVWGNLPYGPGDYLTDGVLDMLYPGYQDSSYFHDEAGFLTPTPYGDAADCLLSDAEEWLLAHYPVLVIAGELAGGIEIRDKLQTYAMQGGRLLITAGNLAKLADGLAGIRIAGTPRQFAGGTGVQIRATKVVEDHSFDLYPLAFPSAGRVLAESSGLPAAVEVPCGKGYITVLASPFGVSSKEVAGAGSTLAGALRNEIDRPLLRPYPLLKHVRAVLDQAFRAQMLFEAGGSLSLITCRKRSGEYTLGIANNSWHERPLKIVSHCGRMESIREIPLDQSEKGAVGYLPEGLEKVDLGVSGENSIAGGDIRIFALQVQEEDLQEIPHCVPPHRPQGRFLPLRDARAIKEEVLARPTFFEHFDGVVVDWRYLKRCEKNDLERESGWIGRQRLRIVVDLTSGINLYPDLRLVDNIPADYSASMAAIEDVMAKMGVLNAGDLILSLHRLPETNSTRQQTWEAFQATLRRLCDEAARRKITLYLRMGPGKPPENIEEAVGFLKRIGAANLHLAPSTALMLARHVDPLQAASLLRDKVGLWLVSAPRTDIAGRLWNANAPVAWSKAERSLAAILAIAPQAPLVFDAVYKNNNEEYVDAKILESLSLGTAQSCKQRQA